MKENAGVGKALYPAAENPAKRAAAESMQKAPAETANAKERRLIANWRVLASEQQRKKRGSSADCMMGGEKYANVRRGEKERAKSNRGQLAEENQKRLYTEAKSSPEPKGTSSTAPGVHHHRRRKEKTKRRTTGTRPIKKTSPCAGFMHAEVPQMQIPSSGGPRSRASGGKKKFRKTQRPACAGEKAKK